MPRLAVALDLGPSPLDVELTDDVLRSVWAEHRERLLARSRPGSRPWAWWRFEASIPEPLRAQRPPLVEVAADEPAGDDRAEENDLELRRAAWLDEHLSAAPLARRPER